MVVVTGLFQGIVTLLLIAGTFAEAENLTGKDLDNSEMYETVVVESVTDNISDN